MAGLRTEHCVEIRVPAKAGGPCFGSGYALAPHWVLTAHHVLFSPDRDPQSKAFQVVWRDTYGCSMPEQNVARNDIVWYSESHDIALIRCEPRHSDLVSPWDLIAQIRPAAPSGCHCVGYLAGLQDEALQPRRKDPTGTLASCSRDEVVADLNNLSIQLPGDQYWSGFSGSAVFSANRLVGTVRTVNTGESGKGLTLSLIAPALLASGDEPGMGRLRDVPDFLVCPGRRACWEGLRAGVVKRLNTHAALREHLVAWCRKDLPRGTEIRGTENLANRLFDLPQLELGRSLNSALDPMLQSPPDEAGIQAVEHLALVWLRLLAAEQGAVPPLAGTARTSNGSPLSVAASPPMLLDLESKLAEASGSDPQLILNLRDNCLRSPLDLTPAHNVGLDDDFERGLQDAKAANALKTRPGMEPENRSGMERFRSGDAKACVKEVAIADTGIPLSVLPRDDAQSGRFVSNLLYFKGKSRNYYVRIPATWEGEEAKASRALGSWAPELLVIDVKLLENLERSLVLGVLHSIILSCRKALSGGASGEDR